MNFHNLRHKSGDPKAQKNQESKLFLNTDLFYNSCFVCFVLYFIFYFDIILHLQKCCRERKVPVYASTGSPKINILCDNLKSYIDTYNNIKTYYVLGSEQIFLNDPFLQLSFWWEEQYWYSESSASMTSQFWETIISSLKFYTSKCLH